MKKKVMFEYDTCGRREIPLDHQCVHVAVGNQKIEIMPTAKGINVRVMSGEQILIRPHASNDIEIRIARD